jgi:hypothetical protein
MWLADLPLAPPHPSWVPGPNALRVPGETLVYSRGKCWGLLCNRDLKAITNAHVYKLLCSDQPHRCGRPNAVFLKLLMTLLI